VRPCGVDFTNAEFCKLLSAALNTHVLFGRHHKVRQVRWDAAAGTWKLTLERLTEDKPEKDDDDE
jgi:hypothetical protein